MVQDHRTIASIDIRDGLLGVRQHRLVLDNSSRVGVTLSHMMLASGKMAIDEADGGIVDYEPRDDTALHNTRSATHRHDEEELSTHLVPISATHPPLDGRDRLVLERRMLRVFDKGAREQPHQILGVDTLVWLVRRHREPYREHEPVVPLLVRRRHLLADRPVRALVLPAQEHRLGRHLARLEVDDLLEPERDHVRAVHGLDDVLQEVDVLERAGELVGFGGVDVPGDDERGDVPVRAELRLALQQLLILNLKLAIEILYHSIIYLPIQSTPSSPSQNRILSSRPTL